MTRVILTQAGLGDKSGRIYDRSNSVSDSSGSVYTIHTQTSYLTGWLPPILGGSPSSVGPFQEPHLFWLPSEILRRFKPYPAGALRYIYVVFMLLGHVEILLAHNLFYGVRWQCLVFLTIGSERMSVRDTVTLRGM